MNKIVLKDTDYFGVLANEETKRRTDAAANAEKAVKQMNMLACGKKVSIASAAMKSGYDVKI